MRKIKCLDSKTLDEVTTKIYNKIQSSTAQNKKDQLRGLTKLHNALRERLKEVETDTD